VIGKSCPKSIHHVCVCVCREREREREKGEQILE
jgi:hypothetical protein